MIRVMKKIILAIIFLTPAITINAHEWTQWRGPSRDGSVSGKNVPDSVRVMRRPSSSSSAVALPPNSCR